VGNPSLNAAQPYAKAEGRVFLLVPACPGCPGTKAVKRLLLLLYSQGVKRETLDQFGVRATLDGRGLALPVYSFTGTLVGVKIVSACEETDSAKIHVSARTIPRYGGSLDVFHCY